MSVTPVFHLTRNGRSMAGAACVSQEKLDDAWNESDDSRATRVDESQLCAFKISGREPDTEYRIEIGDYKYVPSGGSQPMWEIGVGWGSEIVWKDEGSSWIPGWCE